MRYKAKQMTSGDYAVYYGKYRYYPDTITKSKTEAEKLAITKTAHWHQYQIDKMQNAYEAHVVEHEDRESGFGEWEDIMA